MGGSWVKIKKWLFAVAWGRGSRQFSRVHWKSDVGRAAIWAVILGLVSGLGGGCVSASGHKLTWRTLSRGVSSGLVEERREVVRDEAAFLRLWAEHSAELRQLALPPEVDFGREMVLVVAMGRRPTGGYLAEVVDIELRGRTVKVLVQERKPVPGTVQVQFETQPYQFVVMPAVVGRVEFRSVREVVRRPSRRERALERAGEGGSGGGVEGVRDRRVTEPVRSPRGASR